MTLLLLIVPAVEATHDGRPALRVVDVQVEPPASAQGAFGWEETVRVHVTVANEGDAESYEWSSLYLYTQFTGGAGRWVAGGVPVPVLQPGENATIVVSYGARGYVGDHVVRANFGAPQLLSGQPLLARADAPDEALVHVLAKTMGAGWYVKA